MLKIDIHTHILPKNWPDLREKYGYSGFVSLEHHKCGAARMMIDGKLFREIEANSWDANVRIREFQQPGRLSLGPVAPDRVQKSGCRFQFRFQCAARVRGIHADFSRPRWHFGRRRI